MSKKSIATEHAPGAIGPYSQGVVSGGLVCSSGQLPATPDGELVVDDIATAAEHCLRNVFAILKEAGAGPEHVVKVTVFLTEIDDFRAMNQVYAEFFPQSPPARSVVQVVDLPLGADVMIAMIASLV